MESYKQEFIDFMVESQVLDVYKRQVPDRGSPGQLPIHENFRIIHFFQHGVKDIGQLLSGVGNRDSD